MTPHPGCLQGVVGVPASNRTAIDSDLAHREDFALVANRDAVELTTAVDGGAPGRRSAKN